MRRLCFLVALLAPVAAQDDVNPVNSKAAKLLERPEHARTFAVEAGEALLARARKTDAGLTFEEKSDPAVYSGDAGVALFFFRLFAATREPRWRTAGRQTMAQAFSRVDTCDAGFYTGAAGVGQAALVGYRATRDKTYLKMARDCAAVVAKKPRRRVTDIISGEAGIGIFLLNLHAATGDEKDLAAARAVGNWLAGLATVKKNQASWPIGANPRSGVWIGLSHGVAGIGYFLISLHERTGDKRYRTLAEQGARFVVAHALPEGKAKDGYHWYRTVPPRSGETPRVQWCHGAPGTGLFFDSLARVTKDDEWIRARAACVATTRRLGRTARRSGCQCHGVAGNAELFIEVFRTTGDHVPLEDARRFGSALVVQHEGGFRLETRYGPSYMVGLAGIGDFFLRLSAPQKMPLPMMVHMHEKAETVSD